MERLHIVINDAIKEYLPETYKILLSSQLMVHPYVYKVVLTGSRGLAGGCKEDSDIDLSLLFDKGCLKVEEDEEKILKEILNTTILSWKSPIELDTAIVFDISQCHLSCFSSKTFDDRICQGNGVDCLGLYKINKGFNGYVPKIGIDVKKVYPMISVWQREK